MNNPIACTSGGYPGYDLERVLQGVSGAGFRAVELSAIPSPRSRIIPEQMSASDLQQFQARLTSLSLTAVSVSGHSDLAQLEGVAQFKRRIEFAAALGVGIVNTGTGHTNSAADEERFFNWMQTEIIPFAATHQVKIALETHGGLTGTADDCLRTLERLASPWVGINYDPANVIYYRGVRPESDIRKVAAHVIHVHLKDQHGGQGVDEFPPLGEGDIDFQAIVDALDEVGYRGPYSVELEVKNVAGPAEEDALRRQCYQFVEGLFSE